jgi:predicted ATP-grasp superfamily ATP-dependent carboligase
MATILVTDGDERAALAVVRSLGRAGHEVHVASESGRSIAGASRFSESESRVPSPLRGRDEYFEALRRLAQDRAIQVLLPVGEASLRSILGRRDELRPVRIPFPALESFEAVSDKGRLLATGRSLGIADPTLASAESQEALERELSKLNEDRYPIVLKPTRSVVPTATGSRKTSVVYVRTPAEKARALSAVGTEAFPVLIQRRVEGPGMGVFVLLWGGEVLAAFAHRRIREKPPSGGVSVLAESVELPPPLLARSVALLRACAWEGVAMVEYKRDTRTGEDVLMEVNGRFWGSLQLAIDAGVDFPALLARVAIGERPEPVTGYRVGVRTRWTLGDFDHLLARLRKPREALGLPASAPGRVRAGLDFLRASFPPVRSEVCRFGDARPAVREALTWTRLAFRRAPRSHS